MGADEQKTVCDVVGFFAASINACSVWSNNAERGFYLSGVVVDTPMGQKPMGIVLMAPSADEITRTHRAHAVVDFLIRDLLPVAFDASVDRTKVPADVPKLRAIAEKLRAIPDMSVQLCRHDFDVPAATLDALSEEVRYVEHGGNLRAALGGAAFFLEHASETDDLYCILERIAELLDDCLGAFDIGMAIGGNEVESHVRERVRDMLIEAIARVAYLGRAPQETVVS